MTDFDAAEPIAAVPLPPAEGTAPETTSEPAPTAAAAAPTPAASDLDRPFIQLGIFSVEANARNTATAMEVEGLPPRSWPQRSRARPTGGWWSARPPMRRRATPLSLA